MANRNPGIRNGSKLIASYIYYMCSSFSFSKRYWHIQRTIPENTVIMQTIPTVILAVVDQ